MKKGKKITIALATLAAISVTGLAWGTNYLFNYAVRPGEKDFLSGASASGSTENRFKGWGFSTNAPETLSMRSRDHLKLSATYFSQTQSSKTKKLAIIAHGYGSSSKDMKQYAEMFYELGYDLLLPDARAHGKSEGEFIGFGWLDRLDYVDWINKIVNKYDGNVEIALYGISMGGATVMMTSGEKLPDNVKVVIEDCGYDSVKNELVYQLSEMFHLPEYPLVPLASIESSLRANYGFYESSAIKQMEKNERPTLFIHGDQDDFVPTKMVYSVYKATKGPKELEIVKGAKHAQSYKINPTKYKEIVAKFLNKYM